MLFGLAEEITARSFLSYEHGDEFDPFGLSERMALQVAIDGDGCRREIGQAFVANEWGRHEHDVGTQTAYGIDVGRSHCSDDLDISTFHEVNNLLGVLRLG